MSDVKLKPSDDEVRCLVVLDMVMEGLLQEKY